MRCLRPSQTSHGQTAAEEQAAKAAVARERQARLLVRLQAANFHDDLFVDRFEGAAFLGISVRQLDRMRLPRVSLGAGRVALKLSTLKAVGGK